MLVMLACDFPSMSYKNVFHACDNSVVRGIGGTLTQWMRRLKLREVQRLAQGSSQLSVIPQPPHIFL